MTHNRSEKQLEALAEVLSTAIKSGDAAYVAGCLAQGADANRPDARGHLPFFHALYAGYDAALFGALITGGANIDARDRYGDSALHQMAACSQAPVMKALEHLLRLGADPAAENRNGEVVLQKLQENRFIESATRAAVLKTLMTTPAEKVAGPHGATLSEIVSVSHDMTAQGPQIGGPHTGAPQKRPQGPAA